MNIFLTILIGVISGWLTSEVICFLKKRSALRKHSDLLARLTEIAEESLERSESKTVNKE